MVHWPIFSSLIFTNRKKTMQIIPPSVSKLWSLLEIRALVLFSLGLQSILIFTGNMRKNSASKKLSTLLWLTYLSAAWAVIVSLSVLSNNAGNSVNHSVNPDLVITAFWAPFLLLHLGGPDTITAYSLEDELWRRHALTLVTQVTTTVYVVLRCWTSTPLNFLAIPIFVAGIIKSGERIWDLRYASSEHFRESMTHPSYRMSKKSPSYVLGLQFNVPVHDPFENADILQNAYNFFKIFKQLLADVIVNFHDIENSRIIIKNISSEDTFKMIEIELGFI